MPREEPKPPGDPLKNIVLAGQWGMGINQSLAVLWMILTNKWGTFGRQFLFVNVFIALVIIYPCTPLVVEFQDREQMILYGRAWYVLVALTVIHRLASTVTGGRRHTHDVGHCWVGFWKELALLIGVVWALSHACPPLGVLMGVSYLAKQFLLLSIDWRYARIRDAIDSQKFEAEEVQRVLKG